MPSFSRQSGTAPNDERPTLTDGTAVPAQDRADASAVPMRTRDDDTTVTDRSLGAHAAATPATDRADADRAATQRDATQRDATDVDRQPDRTPTVTGPKPRASLLATLGLITAVGSALLVLSGPLAGYGVGLAVLALLLSFGGLRATRRRHVAGKSDALIGLLVALGAIVVGMLALTGSLPWLGTDMDSASRLREWLDSTFGNWF